jgi:hypothetical protein
MARPPRLQAAAPRGQEGRSSRRKSRNKAAQIFTLPYCRFVIGGGWNTGFRRDGNHGRQNGILRHGRLHLNTAVEQRRRKGAKAANKSMLSPSPQPGAFPWPVNPNPPQTCCFCSLFFAPSRLRCSLVTPAFRLRICATLNAAVRPDTERSISHLTKRSRSARVCADEDVPPIPVATKEDRRGLLRPLRCQAEALHHPVRSLPDQQPGAVPKAGRHSALAQGQAWPSSQSAAVRRRPRDAVRRNEAHRSAAITPLQGETAHLRR